ncbi:MAG: class I SAM-dependent methyltransferase [bacterium]|nr:class I SAM-dependent methyltransferase [bacterium]
MDCIDLSSKMLDLLKERLINSTCKLNTFCCSYLDFNYQNNAYEYIIASATLHHLLDDEKSVLYSKLITSLKSNGFFIIGDKFAPLEKDANLKLVEYKKHIQNGLDVNSGQYHIDIPTTLKNEKKLLNETGFRYIKKIWSSKNYTIITALKS